MKIGRFTEAKFILIDLNETLMQVESAHTKQDEGAPLPNTNYYNPYIDERIIIDLSYCYNHECNYRESFNLYKRHLFFLYKICTTGTPIDDTRALIVLAKRFMPKSIINSQQEPSQQEPSIRQKHPRLLQRTLKNFWQTSYYNNLLRACIFLSQDPEFVNQDLKFSDLDREDLKFLSHDSKFEDLDQEVNQNKRLLTYVIDRLLNQKIQEDNTRDCETALLCGYWNVIKEDNQTAQDYFEIASKRNAGYVGQFSFENMESDLDVGTRINRVEYISAYIIHLIKSNFPDYEADIKAEVNSFIQSISIGYQVSLKAAIAMAKWLIDKLGRDSNEAWNLKNGQPVSLAVLCRAFSYIDIYEERGAAAFNQLRSNPSFRLLRPEYRGYILALALSLYEPINKIKEYSTFNLKDLELTRANGMRLVHYTKFDLLMKMIQGVAITEYNSTSSTTQSHNLIRSFEQNLSSCDNTRVSRFRISNSGYVNDISEGRIFIKCIDRIIDKNRYDDHKDFQKLCERFYPQLQRDFDEMSPIGSSVYTASLSIRDDSFPMWKIYSDNELGCNIEFNDELFDIKGVPYYVDSLIDYLPSSYTDNDYPLYNIQYINASYFKSEAYDDSMYPTLVDTLSRLNVNNVYDEQVDSLSKLDAENGNKLLKTILTFKAEYDLKGSFDSTSSVRFVKQDCGTRGIRYKQLREWFGTLHEYWQRLNVVLSFSAEDARRANENPNHDNDRDYDDDYVSDDVFEYNCRKELSQNFDATNAIITFTADRINEIRFLFKDSDYEFEGEVRLIFNDNSQDTKNRTNYETSIPHEYIELERDLRDLTVTLGSKIIDMDVEKIVTWLYKTNLVRFVKLAERNRYSHESTYRKMNTTD